MKLTLIAAIVNVALVCLPVFGAPAPDVPWCRDGQMPPGCRPTQQDVDPDKQKRNDCGNRREGCPSSPKKVERGSGRNAQGGRN